MSARIPKIVVIDDSEIVLAVTREALTNAGYRVVVHDRTAGSVALILQEKPDLVLMDVNMPGLSGDTALSVLARAQPHAETIVLLHSSLPVEILRSKAAAVGAHGFIQKGGDVFGLVRQVKQWLKRLTSSGQMRVAAPVAVDERATATPSSLASVLLVDDDMGVLSVYRRMLQNEDVDVEFALSGGQALRRMLSDIPPDIVVCDMLLPDVSGMEVFQRAVAATPSYRKRFVVATGAATEPSVAAFLAGFAGPVLRKPVAGAQLVSALRACLPGALRAHKAARS
ncbi:MAG TPA: response regulator [Polyangiaceae bacterium]